MIYSTEFSVAELHARAGDEAFQTAGQQIREIDGPHEDEWSLYTTITLDDGQELETILHHGAGKLLNGDCNCPEGRAGLFCSHLVWVGLVHLGLHASPASALAAETAPTDDLRPWLATLSPAQLAKLVIEVADNNLECRRRLHLRSPRGVADVVTETRRRRPAVPRKAKTPTLDVLSADERAGVLTALLLAHPELAAEADGLAAARLESDDSEAVAEDLSYELRALHLEQLADRAGAHHRGRYIEPHEAAQDMLAEVIQPYLNDLDRRMKVGARGAAEQIALGVLAGMYACRHEHDNDRVLTHAGMPDAIDNLATTALTTMDNAGLDLPREWLAEHCPAWSSYRSRPRPN